MKLLQVSYTLFLFNCSETLHNKWFSCLVPADVTYYTSWRNIRGNDTFRCAKSDIPSGGSRFESPSTHSVHWWRFSWFSLIIQGTYRDSSGFHLRLVRAEFLVAKVEQEIFILRCSRFCPFSFIPQCSMPIYVQFICRCRYTFLKSDNVCK